MTNLVRHLRRRDRCVRADPWLRSREVTPSGRDLDIMIPFGSMVARGDTTLVAIMGLQLC